MAAGSVMSEPSGTTTSPSQAVASGVGTETQQARGVIDKRHHRAQHWRDGQ